MNLFITGSPRPKGLVMTGSHERHPEVRSTVMIQSTY